MKMSLQNIVEFQFTANPTYGIQRLRMTPKESERQKILSWEIILKGAKKEIEYVDHHGNVCRSEEHTSDCSSNVCSSDLHTLPL